MNYDSTSEEDDQNNDSEPTLQKRQKLNDNGDYST